MREDVRRILDEGKDVTASRAMREGRVRDVRCCANTIAVVERNFDQARWREITGNNDGTVRESNEAFSRRVVSVRIMVILCLEREREREFRQIRSIRVVI